MEQAHRATLYVCCYLATKYATVAHLGAAPTGLYHLVLLAESEGEDIMPLAIERLEASVARGDSAKQQREVVNLTKMARLNPGVNDLALDAASSAISQNCFGCSIRFKSMEEQAQAILRANPTTAEELKAITDKHPILMPGGKTTQDETLKHVDEKGRLINPFGLDEVEDEDDIEAEDDEAPPPVKRKARYKEAKQTSFDSPQEAHGQEQPSDADHEEGLRVNAVRGLLVRAAEAKRDAHARNLRASDITEAMIEAANAAADAWDALAKQLAQDKAAEESAGDNLDIPDCLRRGAA